MMMAVLAVMHTWNDNGVAGGDDGDDDQGGDNGDDEDADGVGGDAPLKCLQSYVSPLFSLLTWFKWQQQVFPTQIKTMRMRMIIWMMMKIILNVKVKVVGICC